VGATHKNAHILVDKILEEWGLPAPILLNVNPSLDVHYKKIGAVDFTPSIIIYELI
jgi:hypothetical protein